MGTTGSSEKIAMNNALPDILARVRTYTSIPLAVGFGVATRDHFNVVCDAGADGVVIGSRLVSVIKDAPKEDIARHVEAYCREISQIGQPTRIRSALAVQLPSQELKDGIPASNITSDPVALPARFGSYGGQYVPEALVDCLAELEEAHKAAIADPEFWKEFRSHFNYMNRPSQFYLAENLTKDAGGANIWLKREDLSVLVFFSKPVRRQFNACTETTRDLTKLTML
jgi:tryptophan synthase